MSSLPVHYTHPRGPTVTSHARRCV
jgi:hypothetical protein